MVESESEENPDCVRCHMPAYTSRGSLEAYRSLHPKARRICDAVIAEEDHSLLFGYRSDEKQDDLYALGRTIPGPNATPEKPLGDIVTNAKGGESTHNFLYEDEEGRGGTTIDFTPYPIDFKDRVRYARLAGRFMQEAARQGVPSVWGGDWDGDGIPGFKDADERLYDPGHIEFKIMED